VDDVDDLDEVVRISVRVRPGASRTKVGGGFGDALVVAVGARAVDGQATEAARRANPERFRDGPAQVTLVSGATARSKVFELRGDAAQLEQRYRELQGPG
jgi:uncharacterized protein YggU (UPF0235/DUF167 family)